MYFKISLLIELIWPNKIWNLLVHLYNITNCKINQVDFSFIKV